MRAHEQLEQQLDRLQNRPSSDREVIDLALPEGRLYCPLAAVDKIGCALHQLHLEVHARHRDLARIREVSQQLCARLRYLLEPLALIEVDSEEVTAQVRSQEPHREPAGAKYYELLVSPQGLRLQRYSAPRSAPREPVPMQLTHEVLRRLINDFIAAAQRLAASS